MFFFIINLNLDNFIFKCPVLLEQMNTSNDFVVVQYSCTVFIIIITHLHVVNHPFIQSDDRGKTNIKVSMQ